MNQINIFALFVSQKAVFCSKLIAGFSCVFLLSSPTYAVTLGTNLIINGDAEKGQGDDIGNAVGTDIPAIPDWNPIDNFSVLKYGATGFEFINPRGETVRVSGLPDASSPGPLNRGNNLFFGGAGRSSSSASQSINVADLSSIIDAGKGAFDLSAWLGGYATDLDNVLFSIDFLNQDGNSLGQASLISPTPEERSNLTALLFKSTNGILPVGTRKIDATLSMNYVRGRVNDGYADNLSLVITKVPEPSISGVLIFGVSCVMVCGLRKTRQFLQ
ncbi:MAG: PEP-CTERM sorting domain-containing protein [Desmonostoc vinosum HA7617-LM4]|jgi:hypothetical protein|nr:PEP-CTERM sorting domain-containing protein [Desmonostoc vinosum HA7617-LM4]